MKNIEMLLKKFGIELTEGQKTALTKGVEENYKPVADWQKQHDKVENLTEQLNIAKDALKTFDGVNVAVLNKKIEELQADLKKKNDEYAAQLADRDFKDLLKDSISSAKGKNTKAITALLDVESLKGSKNQKGDIAAALKTLSEAEDSKMLFGETEPIALGTGNIIGTVIK